MPSGKPIHPFKALIDPTGISEEDIADAAREVQTYLGDGSYRCEKGIEHHHGRPPQYSDEEILILGIEFTRWCELEESMYITEWASHKKRSYDWWKHLLAYYPALKPFHKRGKEVLGTKMSKKAVQMRQEWLMKAYIPKYLQEAKEALAEQTQTEFENEKRKLELQFALRMQELERKAALAHARVDESEKKIDKLSALMRSICIDADIGGDDEGDEDDE